MKNKKAQMDMLQIIIGILLIGGGVLYLFGQNGLGAVVAGLGVFIEILINWLKQI